MEFGTNNTATLWTDDPIMGNRSLFLSKATECITLIEGQNKAETSLSLERYDKLTLRLLKPRVQ